MSAKHSVPKDQLSFDFNAPYIDKIKKNINKNPKNLLEIGSEISFIDPVFKEEQCGIILKWNGNKIEVKNKNRLFTISESDVIDIIPQNVTTLPKSETEAENEIVNLLDIPENLELLRKYVPESQLSVSSDTDKVSILKKIQAVPDFETNSDNTVFLHYFIGSTDFYITEVDKNDIDTAFGYTILNGDLQNSEYGYMSISEIVHAHLLMNIDYYLQDCTVEQVLEKKHIQEKTVVEKEEILVDNSLEFNPYGSWVTYNKQLGKKEREEINNECLQLLTKNHENLTAKDFDILKQYSGWGGINTDDRGVLYDFYTSPIIANMVWQLTDKIKPLEDGEKVLEPSCGTGVFFEVAPKRVELQGVEISPVSSQIAAIIHSDAQVFPGSFEQFNLVNKTKYDRVIGNVPFGDRSITTAFIDMSEEKNLDRYFISRSLDNLAEYGIMGVIVHPGITNNGTNREWRVSIEKKAQFLGGIRLPNTSFKHTQTQVQPDILFFRKNPIDIEKRLELVNEDTISTLFSDKISRSWVNGEYFQEFRDQVMGIVSVGTGQWGSDVITGDITKESIQNQIEKSDFSAFIDESVFTTIRNSYELPLVKNKVEEIPLTEKEAEAVSIRELTSGSNKTVDGVVYKLNDHFQWIKITAQDNTLSSKIEIIKTIGVNIRQIRTEMQQNKAVNALQLETVKLIENYKRAYNTYPKGDKDISRFLHANPTTKGVYEGLLSADADILTQSNVYDRHNTIFNGHKPEIETLVSLQEKMLRGTIENIDLLYPHFLESDLYTKMLVNKDVFISEDFSFQLREDFLSGQVWDKIDALKNSEKNIPASLPDAPKIKEKIAYGISELEHSIEWIPLEDADITPQASWIDDSIIDDWVKAENGCNLEYKFQENTVARNEEGKWGVISKYDSWESFADPVIYFLNNQKQRSVNIDTESFNEESKDNFITWLSTSDKYRNTLEEKYNHLFNGYIKRPTKTYAVKLDNWNNNITLKPHQWQTIHHLYRAGSGISALDVGFGKTYAALGLMSLLNQENKIQRTWIQVPNNKVKDWVKDTKYVRPDLHIGFIDPEMKGYTNRTKRYAKYQELASGSYDVIIMPESASSEIQLNPKNDEHISETFVWQHLSEKAKDLSARKRETIKENARKQLVDGKTNNTIYFEDFGCDSLFVDEAHNYKNLFTSSLSRETGLNDGRQSDRALALYKKAAYIREKNDQKYVFLLTATPLTNSPLEYYNMMQYVAPKELETFGISTINGFIQNFASIKLKWDADWGHSGKSKQKKKCVGFRNLKTLQNMFFKYTDLQNDAKAIGLEKPNAVNHPTLIPIDKQQSEAINELSIALDEYRNTPKESRPEGVNDLTFFSDFRTASLDLELFDPIKYKGWKSPKIQQVSETAKELYESTKAGQIIFCDRVFSSDNSFNLHEKIKTELITTGGFKPSQIAILNGKTKSGNDQSENQIEKNISEVIDDFNNGKFKIIIATTKMAGEGVNLQKNSIAVHHLDIPYRPSDFIQRNGRVDRQGNKQKTVELYTYLAAGTTDNYSFSLVEGKANWIGEMLNTKLNVIANPNSTDGITADSIKLALLQEYGDEKNANELKAKLQKEKEAQIKEAQNHKRKNNLSSLSLLRHTIANFAGEKDTIQYQNRLRKMHLLEKSLSNNPTFHNHELIHTNESFMYSKKNDRIITPGDIIIHYNTISTIKAFDIKTNMITYDKRVAKQMYSNSESENKTQIDPLKFLDSYLLDGKNYIHHPSDDEKKITDTLWTSDFYSCKNLELQEKYYPIHLQYVRDSAFVFTNNELMVKEHHSIESLNPFNQKDRQLIEKNLSSIKFSPYTDVKEEIKNLKTYFPFIKDINNLNNIQTIALVEENHALYQGDLFLTRNDIDKAKNTANVLTRKILHETDKTTSPKLWKSLKKFKEHGVMDIVGSHIDTKNGLPTNDGWKQLASVLDIYRDKRFETLRYVFIKDNFIVDQIAVSSKVPGRCNIYSTQMGAKNFFETVISHAHSLDAKVVLVHNHPSGNILPSHEDIGVTENFKKMVTNTKTNNSLFGGHIILDHSTYSIYKKVGKVNENRFQWDTIHTQKREDPLVKKRIPKFAKQIVSPLNLPKIAKELNNRDSWKTDEWIPTFLANTQYIITSLVYLPREDLQNEQKMIPKLRNLMQETGASCVFPVVKDNITEDITSNLKNLTKKGVFTDFLVGDKTASDFGEIYPYIGQQFKFFSLDTTTESSYDFLKDKESVNELFQPELDLEVNGLFAEAKNYVEYVSNIMKKAVVKDCAAWDYQISGKISPPHNPVNGQIYNPALFNAVQKLQNTEGNRFVNAKDIDTYRLPFSKRTNPIVTCKIKQDTIEKYSLLYCNDERESKVSKSLQKIPNTRFRGTGTDKFTKNILEYNKAIIKGASFNPIPMNKEEKREVLSYLNKSPSNSLKILHKAAITKESLVEVAAEKQKCQNLENNSEITK